MNIPFQQAGDMIDPDNVFAVIDSKLSTIEREHDLLRFKVDGWCAWAVLRFWVASQMIDIGLTREPATSNLARKLRVALRSLGGFIFPRKARYLVKTYTSARSEQENGRYKDVYFDDLLLKLGNYLKIEAINNFSMWERTKAALVPADMYTAIVEMLVFVFVWLSGATGRYAVMSEEISGILKREASLEITALRISKSLANFHWSRKIFGWYLDRVKPEYLLTADPGEYAITAAAKERGIRCIEIMHGICDRYCWAYSWGTHAVPYKHAMPVADKLLVYGDFIKDEILPLGFWGEALRVTGSV
ncbi:MAG: hypothetical protein FJZ98_10275, partial [Chloroflexi bacterium]|nr:hypothetical protein [Chloroflexota bacterium]